MSQGGGYHQDVLPEHYTLGFMEREFHESSMLPSMESSIASSPSIALSNRSAKHKHDEVQRKRRIETKRPLKTIPDIVLKNMRVCSRRPFSRGHVVPLPGSPIAKHPRGSQPIVLRNNEMGSTGRNAGTARPRTAAEQYARRKNTFLKTTTREEKRQTFVRKTLKMILDSSGQAVPMDCTKSSWTFKPPLDRLTYPIPSCRASSLAYAPVPDCAECILIDGSYGTLAGQAKTLINEKTSKEDRLYLIDQRPKTPSMADVRKPMPNQDPPFYVNYEKPSSPERQPRPVWRKSALAYGA